MKLILRKWKKEDNSSSYFQQKLMLLKVKDEEIEQIGEYRTWNFIMKMNV